MTELQRYLAEEVAEDHADGLIPRREALRRLGLLGLGAAASASLLAAFLAEQAKARVRAASPAPAATRPAAADVLVAARPTREIVFKGPGGRKLMGAWATAAKPRGGVLVIHENRGLNDSIRAIAGRLAGSGYSALAIDLLSEEGGTGSFEDEFEAMSALGAAPESRLVADLKAGVTRSAAVPGKKVAAIGFCFGGGMTWRLLAAKESRLAAAVPFYGPFPEGGNLAGSEGGGTRDLRRARLQGERQPGRRACGTSEGRSFGTRSSPTRTSTTRSSIPPAHGTTRLLRLPPTGECWTGSART